jgi:AcrR family transcriptional regulator
VAAQTPSPDGRREEVLDAALALADEQGLEAVSMRAVAARLGVTPMALYRHVGTKAGLLDALVARLLAEIPLPDPGAAWDERLRAMARGLRDAAQLRPSLPALLLARPVVDPAGLRIVEAMYAALRDAGVPAPEIPRLERLVSTFALGWLASEAAGRLGPGELSPRERRARLPPAEFPVHHALARHLDAPSAWDEELDADVDDLIALIRAKAGSG